MGCGECAWLILPNYQEEYTMSDRQLACIGCMTGTDLSLHAHRNVENKIIGFIAVCPNCQESIGDYYMVMTRRIDLPTATQIDSK